jgi:predicted dinucleotide-binding enzyme
MSDSSLGAGAIGSAPASQLARKRIDVMIANNSQRERAIDSLKTRCRQRAGGLGARLGTCYVPKRCLRQPIQVT